MLMMKIKMTSQIATADHADEEDQIMIDTETQSCFGIEIGQRGGWVINKSGLHSLLFQMQSQKAKGVSQNVRPFNQIAFIARWYSF